MKRAKVIITLQVAFLALTIMFSTGIAYNNGYQQQGLAPAPTADTHLKLKLEGVELSNEEAYNNFEGLRGLNDEIQTLGSQISRGQIPDNAVAIPGIQGAYMARFIDPRDNKLMFISLSINELPNTDGWYKRKIKFNEFYAYTPTKETIDRIGKSSSSGEVVKTENTEIRYSKDPDKITSLRALNPNLDRQLKNLAAVSPLEMQDAVSLLVASKADKMPDDSSLIGIIPVQVVVSEGLFIAYANVVDPAGNEQVIAFLINKQGRHRMDIYPIISANVLVGNLSVAILTETSMVDTRWVSVVANNNISDKGSLLAALNNIYKDNIIFQATNPVGDNAFFVYAVGDEDRSSIPTFLIKNRSVYPVAYERTSSAGRLMAVVDTNKNKVYFYAKNMSAVDYSGVGFTQGSAVILDAIKRATELSQMGVQDFGTNFDLLLDKLSEQVGYAVKKLPDVYGLKAFTVVLDKEDGSKIIAIAVDTNSGIDFGVIDAIKYNGDRTNLGEDIENIASLANITLQPHMPSAATNVRTSSAGLAQEVTDALTQLIANPDMPTLERVEQALQAAYAKYAASPEPGARESVDIALQALKSISIHQRAQESVLAKAQDVSARSASQTQPVLTVYHDIGSMPSTLKADAIRSLGTQHFRVETLDVNTIPNDLKPENSIIITANLEVMQAALERAGKEKTKILPISQLDNDQFVPFVQLTQQAKDILLLSISGLVSDNILPTIRTRIGNTYTALTGGRFVDIDAYISNPAAYIINLAPAVAPFYEPGQLETLYNMIIQAAQAA
jgi:hypothetical protein